MRFQAVQFQAVRFQAVRFLLVLLALMPIIGCNRNNNAASTVNNNNSTMTNDSTIGPSEVIARQFEASGGKSVDLAKAVPSAWDRVCILGPYTGDLDAKQMLGFEWKVTEKTKVTAGDSMSLLIFVRGNEVVKYVEHPRNQGDFSNLTKQCFSRSQANFVHNAAPQKGWPGLFQKN